MPPFFKSFQSSKSSKNIPKNQSHYQILELPNDATFEEIKFARKRLAKTYHPDKNLDNQDFAHVKQQQINEAYKVLSDEKSRADYDYELKYGRKRYNHTETSDSDEESENSFWSNKKSETVYYKFKNPRTGEETYFTEDDLQLIFMMKLRYEQQKYGCEYSRVDLAWFVEFL